MMSGGLREAPQVCGVREGEACFGIAGQSSLERTLRDTVRRMDHCANEKAPHSGRPAVILR